MNIKLFNKNDEVVAKTVIDEIDFRKVNKSKWWLNKGYAVGFVNGRHIKLHQYILGNKPGYDIDHINRDKLDNRRNNLRHITHSQNIVNSKISISNKSGRIGVHWGKHIKKWIAEIKFNRKIIYLGSFVDKNKAIKARKAAELKYFGCVRG